MLTTEDSIRSLLEMRRRRHELWIADETERYGHVRNPLTLQPRPLDELPLPYPSGITDRRLDSFERRRGFSLPKSLRKWLTLTNGAMGFFGIKPMRSSNDMEREMDFWSDWSSRGWIPVASDDFGNRFIQLVDNVGADGLEPVCYVEVISDCIAYVAASNMMLFALMKLEDEFQLHEAQIDCAKLAQYLPKRRLRNGAEPVRVDWQFNKRYMFMRDPDLKKIEHLPLPWARTKSP